MPAAKAKKMLAPKPYEPFYEDPTFAKAKELGISRNLVIQAARWIIEEDKWKNFEITKTRYSNIAY